MATQPVRRVHGAVIVTRVSTGDQAKNGTSLESQLDLCRAKALSLDLPIIGEYEDAGISGRLFLMRGGMQKALADIQAGRADTLICHSIGRFSRIRGHQANIIALVEKAGGQIEFCDMTFDDSPQGRFARNMMGDYAEMESDIIRERSVTGKLMRVKHGIQPCRTMRPFAYQIVSKNDVLHGFFSFDQIGKYVIVEEEAKWLREMFCRYANGTSVAKIGHWLQDNGVEPIRGAKHWHPNTIVGILRNPVYKGLATYGKRKRMVDEDRLLQGHPRPDYQVDLPVEEWKYIPAPALVDVQVWEQCQVRLRENQARLSGNNKRRHMLTGLLHCPACGRNMRSKKTRTYVHFHCRDYSAKANVTGNVCHPKHYNSRTLEEMVAALMAILARRPELMQEALEAFQERNAGQDDTAERDDLEAKLLALANKQSATVRAQIAGVQAGADVTAYDPVFQEIREQRDRTKARLDALTAQRPEQTWEPGAMAEEVSRRLERVEEVLLASELPADRKHELLTTIIQSIVPDPEQDHRLRVVLRTPILSDGQTVRCMVMRRSGNSKPLFLMALRTRSRDS